MKYLLIILLLSIATAIHAQDYNLYHTAINKAEEEAYLKEDIPAGLKTYISTFNGYDFVFLHDCFDAMQLALYINDAKSFLLIANKATLNGWRPLSLSRNMSFMKNHPIYIKYKDSLVAMQRRNRPHYLKRIDTAAIKKMYMLYAYDQLEKNNLKGEAERDYKIRYTPQVSETMKKLQKLIAEKGWPADKLLGIGQDSLMHELHLNSPELIEFYKKHKDEDRYNVSVSQYEFEPYELGNALIAPIIMHYVNMRKDFSDRKRYLLYPDTFYRRQIKLGNMHPKDLAGWYDRPFGMDSTSIPNAANGEKYFAVGLLPAILYYNKQLRIPDAQLNIFRTAYGINSMEVQRAKFQFVRKHGMFLGWGWGTCRS